MTENPDEIVFECPHCRQSMAIDRKAAGLVVQCPKCEKQVKVPRVNPETAVIPPDPTQEEIPPDQVRILLDSLATSQTRIQQMTDQFNETQRRRAFLERMRAEHLSLFNEIHEQLETIKASYDRLVEIMEDAP